MNKKVLSIVLMLLGGCGALLLSAMAVADSQADDILSAIPLTMVFCTLFICGFFAYFKDK